MVGIKPPTEVIENIRGEFATVDSVPWHIIGGELT